MSESNEKEQMPGLRYHDQTPFAKADNKRLRSAFAKERCNLKAKCESELRESYNRRKNLRRIGLPEEVSDDPTKKNDEDYYTTIEKVVDLASALQSSITSDDISIAHRLPYFNRHRPRHVIVRFSRQVAKIIY